MSEHLVFWVFLAHSLILSCLHHVLYISVSYFSCFKPIVFVLQVIRINIIIISSLPEITEQRIFHVLFYCEQIRLKCITNCIYPSWLNFEEYYFCIFVAKSYIVYKNMNFIHLLLSQFFTVIFHFRTSNSLQNYQNFLSWSRNVIMISKRSKGLLA